MVPIPPNQDTVNILFGTNITTEKEMEAWIEVPRVYFINGFVPLRPTFEKLFTGAKVWRKARKFGVGHKTVYEIDPWLLNHV